MSKIIWRIIQRLPNPDKITNIELSPTECRFTFFNTRFRVSDGFSVEEVRGQMLYGSVAAMLLQALLRRPE